MASGRKTGVRPEKLADFLEVAYDVTTDDRLWLRQAMEAALTVTGWGVASHAAIYDASDVSAFRVENAEFIGLAEREVDILMRGLKLFTPSFVTRTFRSLLANGVRQIGIPEMRPMVDEMAGVGFPDQFALNGLEPSGRGVFIGLWSKRMLDLSSADLAFFRRIAHHLGAAHRVRRRLRESQPDAATPDPTLDAEAIFDAKARVVHATGPATAKAARDELVVAARARDRARTRVASAEAALRDWRPLTRARWTLVDSFERGGARYVVARENQSPISGLESLTDRERQAVVYLAVGQSTKETAYALGISSATVRVLLARAAAKLGVRTRAALLAHAEVRGLTPGGTPGRRGS
jgi:DNA-binding CsgD family transcriptional regulator